MRMARAAGEWPFYLVCVWAPVWWAMGLMSLAFVVLAPFMVWSLARHRRRLQFPPPAVWWFGFLLVALLGLLALGRVAPGTLPEARSGQILAWLVDLVVFVTATLVMVWICSHDESSLPLRRLMHYFGVLGLWTVAGGYLGLIVPHLAFRSPTELLLRATVGPGPWLSLLDSPRAAQVQDVLGDATSPRPAAPFPYTNSWGQMLSLLLVLGLAVWLTSENRWTRVRALLVVPVAAVPALLSLNRGLWIGVVVMVIWILVQLLRAGRLGAVVAGMCAVAVLAVALVLSPAGQLIEDRGANGHSDSIRAALAADAVTGAIASPVIGWGGMRQIQGSPQSIAIGSSENCQQCGNRRIGSTGLLWYMMFAHGLLGAALYVTALASTLWRYRRDVTPTGVAASGVVVLSLVYMFTYTNSSIGLLTTLAAMAILYRNEQNSAGGFRHG